MIKNARCLYRKYVIDWNIYIGIRYIMLNAQNVWQNLQNFEKWFSSLSLGYQFANDENSFIFISKNFIPKEFNTTIFNAEL